jgi:mono/diheme cytochrome c family protein
MTTLAAGGLLLTSVSLAFAQDDPAVGLALARQWCNTCHLVEPDGEGVDAAPAFEAVANDPMMTPERLRGWLTAPHPVMPDLNLTRDEIAALATYIESLEHD